MSFKIEKFGFSDLTEADRDLIVRTQPELENLRFVVVSVDDLEVRITENKNNAPGCITIEGEASLEILPGGPNVIRLRKRRECR